MVIENYTSRQPPGVQRLYSLICWINHYPAYKMVGVHFTCWIAVYPVDNKNYPSFEQLGPDFFKKLLKAERSFFLLGIAV